MTMFIFHSARGSNVIKNQTFNYNPNFPPVEVTVFVFSFEIERFYNDTTNLEFVLF